MRAAVYMNNLVSAGVIRCLFFFYKSLTEKPQSDDTAARERKLLTAFTWEVPEPYNGSEFRFCKTHVNVSLLPLL
jgi:hypothetical protein